MTKPFERFSCARRAGRPVPEMAALALRPDREGATLERLAADYLRAEVLDSLSAAEQDLLMRVTIVAEVSPEPGCGAGRAARRRHNPRGLERRNAFVQSVPTRPGHHRFHPLLRALLATRRAAARGHRPRPASHRLGVFRHGRAGWFPRWSTLWRPVTGSGPPRGAVPAHGSGRPHAGGAPRAPPSRTCFRGLPAAGGPDVRLVRAALALGQGDSRPRPRPSCPASTRRARRRAMPDGSCGQPS